MHRGDGTKFLFVWLGFATTICCIPAAAQNDQGGIGSQSAYRVKHNLDWELSQALRRVGFTGRVESTLQQRLGRSINQELANLGRLLWFDVIGGLHDDNTCGGCHSPTDGMGDTQSIAI